MKFNHINIKAKMPFLEKEKKFLCEVLGFKDGHRPKFNKKGFWIYSGNEPIIHLTEGENNTPNTGYIDHLAFQSSDAKSFITKLNKLNIKYTSSYIHETNALQIFLKSPLDIKFEIVFINENQNVFKS